MRAASAARCEAAALTAAALRHPDPSWRLEFRNHLDTWAEHCRCRLDPDQLRNALRSVRGTELEPFEITDDDLALAVLLARVALSECGQQTRFRVVSRTTIGATGGAVLTSNGKVFFSERFAHGKNRTPGTHFWHLAPAMEPPTFPATAARWVVDDEGVMLRLPATCALPGAAAGNRFEPFAPRRLQARVHDARTRTPGHWGDIPLRIRNLEDGPRVAPATAEATLRLTALCDGSLLEIAGLAGRTALMRLSPPDDGVELDTVISLPEDWGALWLSVDTPVLPPLPAAAQNAIVRWIGPPPTWMGSSLLSEVA